MASLVSAKTQADHQRHLVTVCQETQVSDGGHDIIRLVSGSRCRNLVIVPQILLGRMEFDDAKGTGRRSPGKICIFLSSASGNPCKEGSVAGVIGDRNQGQRIRGS